MTKPSLSVIVPVYNKLAVLPSVLTALRSQAHDVDLQVLALDDGSMDGSLEILQTLAAEWPALKVLHDGRNLGPSLRINQALPLIHTPWVFLMDADAILLAGALAGLLRLQASTQADALHAEIERVESLEEAVKAAPWEDPPARRFEVSDRPLHTLLKRRGIVRMAWLVGRDCLLKANGADPGVFIQDESLPLRIARAAGRLTLVRAVVACEPPDGSHLSSQSRQTHHDRLLAYLRFRHECTDLAWADHWRLTNRCLSAARRAGRSGLLASTGSGRLARAYYLRKLGLPWPVAGLLRSCEADLNEQLGIRRPELGQ